MLTDDDKTKLKNLGAVEKHAAIVTEIHNLHRAINDGTLDRDAANVSLERLTAMNGDAPDKATINPTLTGQASDRRDLRDQPQPPANPASPNPLTAPFTAHSSAVADTQHPPGQSS